jgi:hypothetical protein
MRVPQTSRDTRSSGSRHLRPAAAAIWGMAGILLALAVLMIANHP